jgi:hypothetical protein
MSEGEHRDRFTAAIDANTYRWQHNELFAARQALSWAINPNAFASPYGVIMGTREDSAGCLVEPRPPSS